MRRLQRTGKTGVGTKHFRENERGYTGLCVNDNTSREIYGFIVEHPACAGPYPVNNRRIDEDKPQGAEEHHRREVHPLHESADNQPGSDDRDGHVDHDEHDSRNAAFHAVSGNNLREKDTQVTDPGIVTFKSEALDADDPEKRSQAGQFETVHQHREQVLCAHEATVEQGEPRKGHQKNQDGANDHQGGIARIDRRSFRGSIVVSEKVGEAAKEEQPNEIEWFKKRCDFVIQGYLDSFGSLRFDTRVEYPSAILRDPLDIFHEKWRSDLVRWTNDTY